MTTPIQRANLAKLADYLAVLVPPPGFDMGSWLQRENSLDEDDFNDEPHLCDLDPKFYAECGTTACAIGHGPLAGIPPTEADYNWESYCENNFTGDSANYISAGPIFTWLFHSNWSWLDNTPEGAARRVRHFLEHGLPVVFAPSELAAGTYAAIFDVQ